ncbi:uncharacterized protein LOC122665997 [Telopea speciosissima]|uniref:uncharacterized protein LOC122665997 n=1 Tax=Telopea speciosissima TaxID=54955 RepID=UPI001CC7F128|nr:uncharacterized protein LOC122665997 [Telopea speciosissima]
MLPRIIKAEKDELALYKPILASSEICIFENIFEGEAIANREVISYIQNPSKSIRNAKLNVYFNSLIPKHHQFRIGIIPSSDNWKKKLEIQFDCSSTLNQTHVCPTSIISPAMMLETTEDYYYYYYEKSARCPDYFKFIQEDLRPWKDTGITREMVENAKNRADFRLVIVNGRIYVEIYKRSFQTRDLFTWWGIVQLLRKYPGRLPNLDLMFNCGDLPKIRSTEYQQPNTTTAPPPLFQYCGDATSLAIVFPDWSFWGWPEVNIKPWELLSEELREANERSKWIERKPYAFWRGNPLTSKAREELMNCNSTYIRAYAVNWKNESLQGFKESDLMKHCSHRYKIYIEGVGWSVSQKYILACDSVSLVVQPNYYDFMSRILMPMHHYWPIRSSGNDMCKDIKVAIEWGNSHHQEAQGIGRTGSKFIEKELKMDYVYDYMFNLLNEYGKLMKYKPTIPENASEICSETMACPAEDGLVKKYMMDSMVNATADSSPCIVTPPSNLLRSYRYFFLCLTRRGHIIIQVFFGFDKDIGRRRDTYGVEAISGDMLKRQGRCLFTIKENIKSPKKASEKTAIGEISVLAGVSTRFHVPHDEVWKASRGVCISTKGEIGLWCETLTSISSPRDEIVLDDVRDDMRDELESSGDNGCRIWIKLLVDGGIDFFMVDKVSKFGVLRSLKDTRSIT